MMKTIGFLSGLVVLLNAAHPVWAGRPASPDPSKTNPNPSNPPPVPAPPTGAPENSPQQPNPPVPQDPPAGTPPQQPAPPENNPGLDPEQGGTPPNGIPSPSTPQSSKKRKLDPTVALAIGAGLGGSTVAALGITGGLLNDIRKEFNKKKRNHSAEIDKFYFAFNETPKRSIISAENAKELSDGIQVAFRLDEDIKKSPKSDNKVCLVAKKYADLAKKLQELSDAEPLLKSEGILEADEVISGKFKPLSHQFRYYTDQLISPEDLSKKAYDYYTQLSKSEYVSQEQLQEAMMYRMTYDATPRGFNHSILLAENNSDTLGYRLKEKLPQNKDFEIFHGESPEAVIQEHYEIIKTRKLDITTLQKNIEQYKKETEKKIEETAHKIEENAREIKKNSNAKENKTAGALENYRWHMNLAHVSRVAMQLLPDFAKTQGFGIFYETKMKHEALKQDFSEFPQVYSKTTKEHEPFKDPLERERRRYFNDYHNEINMWNLEGKKFPLEEAKEIVLTQIPQIIDWQVPDHKLGEEEKIPPPAEEIQSGPSKQGIISKLPVEKDISPLEIFVKYRNLVGNTLKNTDGPSLEEKVKIYNEAMEDLRIIAVKKFPKDAKEIEELLGEKTLKDFEMEIEKSPEETTLEKAQEILGERIKGYQEGGEWVQQTSLEDKIKSESNKLLHIWKYIQQESGLSDENKKLLENSEVVRSFIEKTQKKSETFQTEITVEEDPAKKATLLMKLKEYHEKMTLFPDENNSKFTAKALKERGETIQQQIEAHVPAVINHLLEKYNDYNWDNEHTDPNHLTALAHESLLRAEKKVTEGDHDAAVQHFSATLDLIDKKQQLEAKNSKGFLKKLKNTFSKNDTTEKKPLGSQLGVQRDFLKQYTADQAVKNQPVDYNYDSARLKEIKRKLEKSQQEIAKKTKEGNSSRENREVKP